MKVCLRASVNLVDPVGLEGGFWGGMKKIGAGFGKLFEKAPAGIAEAVVEGTKGAGQAFERLGHEYATNKDLQKYTGIALGAGALPIAAATAPQTLPAMGRAAGAAANAAKSRMSDAATTAAGTILSNPEKVAKAGQAASEFAAGLIDPGPYPNTPAGVAGAIVSKGYEKANQAAGWLAKRRR